MIAGAVALAGCSPVMERDAEPTIPTGDADTCNATDYAGFLGQPAAAVSLPSSQPHRIYPVTGIVTQDYRPERLNLVTDAGGGTVIRLWCG